MSGHNLAFMCSSYHDNGRDFFFVQVSRSRNAASHVGTFLFDYMSGEWRQEERIKLPNGIFGGVKVSEGS